MVVRQWVDTVLCAALSTLKSFISLMETLSRENVCTKSRSDFSMNFKRYKMLGEQRWQGFSLKGRLNVKRHFQELGTKESYVDRDIHKTFLSDISQPSF